MTTITNMPLYRAIVVHNGIKLWLDSGKRIIPSRGWTPTNMLKAVYQITGKQFKRGQHEQAAKALSEYIEVAKLKGKTLQDTKSMNNHPDYQEAQ